MDERGRPLGHRVGATLRRAVGRRGYPCRVTTRAAPALRAAALVAATLLASGCAVFSPVQTDEPYIPADGVPLTTSDLELRNLALVSTAAGADAVVVGQVVNPGTSSVQVSFGVDGGSSSAASAIVPATSGDTISDETTRLTIPALAAAPGEVVDLVVTTSGSGQNVVTVPVLAARDHLEVFDTAP